MKKLCVLFCQHTIVSQYVIQHHILRSKVRPFQKLIEKQAFHLLKNLGSQMNFYKNVEHAKMFYQAIMYSGLPAEYYWNFSSHVSKAKDQDKLSSYIWWGSIVEHLKRSDLQCLIWEQFAKQNMIIPILEGRACYMKGAKILSFLCFRTIISRSY